MTQEVTPGKRRSIDLVGEVATRWNQLGLRYVVAHGVECFPKSIGRDLDIIADANDAKRMIRIASEILSDGGRCRVGIPPSLWGQRVVAAQISAPETAVELHTMPRLAWHGVSLLNGFERDRSIGPFPIDTWVHFTKRILLPLLGNEIQRVDLRPADMEITQIDRRIASERLARLVDVRLAERFIALVEERDTEGLEILLPQVRAGLLRRSVTRSPVKFVHTLSWQASRRARRPFNQCVPWVIVLGVNDEVANELVRQLSKELPLFAGSSVRDASMLRDRSRLMALVLTEGTQRLNVFTTRDPRLNYSNRVLRRSVVVEGDGLTPYELAQSVLKTALVGFFDMNPSPVG